MPDFAHKFYAALVFDIVTIGEGQKLTPDELTDKLITAINTELNGLAHVCVQDRRVVINRRPHSAVNMADPPTIHVR